VRKGIPPEKQSWRERVLQIGKGEREEGEGKGSRLHTKCYRIKKKNRGTVVGSKTAKGGKHNWILGETIVLICEKGKKHLSLLKNQPQHTDLDLQHTKKRILRKMPCGKRKHANGGNSCLAKGKKEQFRCDAPSLVSGITKYGQKTEEEGENPTGKRKFISKRSLAPNPAEHG